MPLFRHRVSGTSQASNGISTRYVQIGTDITTPGVGGFARPSLRLKPWMKELSSSVSSGQVTALGLTATPIGLSSHISDWPKSLSSSYNVVATSAAITLAPQNAVVTAVGIPTDVVATSASITIAPQDATVVALGTTAVVATSASITITAFDAVATLSEPANTWFNDQWWPVPTFGVDKWWGIGYAAQVTATSASLTIAPSDAVVHANVDLHVTATAAAITITPENASVIAGSELNVTATAAAITLAPQPATVQANVDTNVTATAAAISLAPENATVRAHKNVTATTANITLTPFPASVGAVTANINVVATSAAITIESKHAIVTAGSTRRINGATPLIIASNYQSKTLYCSPASGWFTID